MSSPTAGLRAISYITTVTATIVCATIAIAFAIPAIYFTITTGVFSYLWIGAMVSSAFATAAGISAYCLQ